MDWLKKRAAEPSTYGGLAALTLGLGQLLKINEAPLIADSIGQAAPSLTSGDYATGGAMIFFGLLGAFLGERKD